MYSQFTKRVRGGSNIASLSDCKRTTISSVFISGSRNKRALCKDKKIKGHMRVTSKSNIRPSSCNVLDHTGRKIGVGRRINGLYHLEYLRLPLSSYPAVSLSATSNLWHSRFSHLSMSRLKTLMHQENFHFFHQINMEVVNLQNKLLCFLLLVIMHPKNFLIQYTQIFRDQLPFHPFLATIIMCVLLMTVRGTHELCKTIQNFFKSTLISLT